MTIGPAPSTRTESRSLRRGMRAAAGGPDGGVRDEIDSGRICYEAQEAVEVDVVLVRPGRGLRMVLDGEDGQLAMLHPFERAVVEAHLGDLDGALGQRVRVEGEAVVLGRDAHFAGAQVVHRMIDSAVPELELEALAAKRQ